ncbi:MAG: hypothetical protein ACRD3F_09675, partial [Acidobacteriaceae bacterium]
GGGIIFDEAACHELGGDERWVEEGSGLVALEQTMLVAARNAGPLKQNVVADIKTAVAWFGGEATVGAPDDDHSHSIASGA